MGYTSTLLHQATDRQPGQNDLRQAYGAELTIRPEPEA